MGDMMRWSDLSVDNSVWCWTARLRLGQRRSWLCLKGPIVMGEGAVSRSTLRRLHIVKPMPAWPARSDLPSSNLLLEPL